ncbi:hypothetical protein FHG64_03430 [Antarcticibacterium flavum]|uniref:Aerotolerance regulator N-terminal domain-containing protein n=1 Tax=Antarcticibacterium flavum TaxID=2058175 RepID=A0A5B7WZB5_9FLAO|nr:MULTISPECIES: BatA domain-containing protein [Antarcticibacterium]MCM4158662.1 hypothetical protein [Antarcticibacterium sp. W02-3]QCY68516.1 hypothetical protein FHG64_03430 [Antarcticibacterium flavum]
MIFLNPAYLWALLGFAVPVAIHLWSRKEGRTIKIGSTKLLRESDPKQSSSLHLNELWLLFLRMLVLTVLVLILAEPQLKQKVDPVPVTYLVEPSLLSYEQVTSVLDTPNPNASVRLLEPGFAEYEKGYLSEDPLIPNYWQLSKEMEELETDSIVVFTNAFAAGFKGKRPELNRNINWIVLDPGEPMKEPVLAQRVGDEVKLISVISDNQLLKFEKEQLPVNSDQFSINEQGDSIIVSSEGREVRLALKPQDSLSVLLVHDENSQDELRYLQAAYNALGNYLEIPIEVESVTEGNISMDPENYNTVVWLSSEPAIETSAPLLIYKPDSLVTTLIEKGNFSNEYFLTRPLNSENIVEGNLAEELFALLNQDHLPESGLEEYDRRVISPEEFQPMYTAGVPNKRTEEGTGINAYLWLLLLLLLVAERTLSYYRKQ